ncbi:MAG: hypothetical protein R3Y51_07635 [Rikenellaceae bacterium]
MKNGFLEKIKDVVSLDSRQLSSLLFIVAIIIVVAVAVRVITRRMEQFSEEDKVEIIEKRERKVVF